MKPFNIKLSDEHRAKLEAYRRVMGLRSEADAVRHMIGLLGAYDTEGKENEILAEMRADATRRPQPLRFPTAPIGSRLDKKAKR